MGPQFINLIKPITISKLKTFCWTLITYLPIRGTSHEHAHMHAIEISKHNKKIYGKTLYGCVAAAVLPSPLISIVLQRKDMQKIQRFGVINGKIIGLKV